MMNPTKAACLTRLSRIEGQVRGLSRMVEDDRYCIDVITQVAAIRAALSRVEDEILRDHMGHCIKHAMTSGSEREQKAKVEELMDVFARSKR